MTHICDYQYLIERIKDGTGPHAWRKGTRIVFTGSLADKPKGWRVICRIN